ncbi:MAG: hypothetical protein M1832_002234 [Thelocarpon impressellum]|nr:MAG: hypothetical protein M1832_002234 [Thelocarpon impressellum]
MQLLPTLVLALSAASAASALVLPRVGVASPAADVAELEARTAEGLKPRFYYGRNRAQNQARGR